MQRAHRPGAAMISSVRPALRALATVLAAVLLVGCAPFPAPLPTPTQPPTQAPSPRPVLSPTPRPTPTARARRSAADGLLRNGDTRWSDGDYSGALALYEQVRSDYADTPAAEEALLRIARTYLEMDRPLSASLVLTPALDGLTGETRHRADFLLAEALRRTGACPLAVPLYLRYREEGTALDDLVAERLAWCYRALGEHARAAEEFARAAGPYRSASDQVGALEQAALELRQTGAYTDALGRYEQILAIARYPWYRAAILFQMGETLQQAGRPEEAQARWQGVLSTYPQTAAAARAADALLTAGAAVDAYRVGQAYAAVGRTDEAVARFQEALEQGQQPQDELRYALAQARADQGDLAGALAELEPLVAAAEDARPLQEQARLLAAAGSVDEALAVYGLIAERFPEEAVAAEALYRAGLLLEEWGRFDEAVSMYEALLARFPGHPRAAAARFQAGLLRYRQGRFAAAAALWQEENGSARASLWLGLALARLGRRAEARKVWEEAAAGRGYYAARARELLSTGPGFGEFHQPPLRGNESAARREAQAWLEELWEQPIPAALPARLRTDPCFQRGRELLALGLVREARQPFALLIERQAGDGPALYALALYLREKGLYAQSILCTYRLLEATGLDEADAPEFLRRLLYPTPYAHLIVPLAQQEGVDPLLFFALVRQESLFDRYATSWAEARGLTQVIPSTGEWIAGVLGYTPFAVADLYRPVVSVHFGVWYLGQVQDEFGGQALPALAGYNGGPGNARRWAGYQVPVPDLDLFVERVDFSETRDYLEKVYTFYWTYRALYAPDSLGR